MYTFSISRRSILFPMPILMAILHWLSYHSFVISFKIEELNPPISSSVMKIVRLLSFFDFHPNSRAGV